MDAELIQEKIIKNLVPINFYYQLFLVGLKVSLLLGLSWGMVYVLSDQNQRDFISTNKLLTFLIYISFLSIALLQTWINGKIFIYDIQYKNGHLIFKWQKHRFFHEKEILVKGVSAKIIPSGKDNPYLELKLNDENGSIILKQTQYKGWEKEDIKRFVKEMELIQNLGNQNHFKTQMI